MAGLANAYPSIMAHLSDQAMAAAPNEKRQTPVSIPPFDAASQYVSNQGQHAFVPPGPTDQRGPCPGLNVSFLRQIIIHVSSNPIHVTTGHGKSQLHASQRHCHHSAVH